MWSDLALFIVEFSLLIPIFGLNPDEGTEERPIMGKDIDLNNFLRSYNYVNAYEQVIKKSGHDVLAYITPWNSKGYEKAELFANKFTIIAPVWFQLKPVGYEIIGHHNFDQKWMERVKSVKNDVRFAPRIIFEDWGAGDYQLVLSNGKNRVDCIKALRKLAKTDGVDGLTLEVWMQHFGTSQNILIDFLIELAKGLHKDGKILILPIPPSVYKGNFEGRFGKAHFDMLVNHVDFFSLMTYDYSNPYAPGENAPLKWATQCVRNLVPDGKDDENQATKRAKILLGVNFYGYDYVPDKRQGRAVLGHDVVEVAKKYSPFFKWHEESAEHSLEYADDSQMEHSLFFPTAYSIARRVAVAEELGVGLSIWEIGQGFDSFFEQL
ncbi:Chitinase domain-containing protein 1 [Taenia solium]|eukprot:TsM_000327800 transcript=TsM_000327800 gene=TsM_000327800